MQRDLRAGLKPGNLATNRSAACACTEGGIDCQAWNDCQSCYQWVREDGEGLPDPDGTNPELAEEAQAHAQRLELEDKMADQEAQIQQQQDFIVEQDILIQECYAFNNASKEEWQELCVNCDSPDFQCRDMIPTPCLIAARRIARLKNWC